MEVVRELEQVGAVVVEDDHTVVAGIHDIYFAVPLFEINRRRQVKTGHAIGDHDLRFVANRGLLRKDAPATWQEG